MKKLIQRFSLAMLLIFSILFGALNTSTPVFADSILDILLGILPSDDSEKISDEIGEEIREGGDYGLPEGNNKDQDQQDLEDLIWSDRDDTDEKSQEEQDLEDLIWSDRDDEDNQEDNDLEDLIWSDRDDQDQDDQDQQDLEDLIWSDRDDTDENGNGETAPNTCQNESQGASWVLCTAFALVTNASDTIYGLVEDLLAIDPLPTNVDTTINADSDDVDSTALANTAIYRVWDYMRGFTNIVFIIFLLIVIYSQITGLGINNYGVKRILPRLIIAVILVNLSYIICAILVDASNIVGNGISGIFDKIITDTGLNNVAQNKLFEVDWSTIYLALTGSAVALALFSTTVGGLGGAFWVAIFLIIGVLLSILSGLITIGLRQVLVTLLVAISPLAFVAYLLPNTEKWFNKWKALLAQMIFFYPIFAFLFYASKLAGLTIIGNSGGSIFQVIVGLAVQVLPLFLSVSLLKMSGTILGKVSSGLDRAFGYATKPLQGWAMSHREQKRQQYLARNIAPGAKLRNFLAKRQALREMNILDNQEIVTNRAAEAALNKRASYLGIDDDGKPIWGTRIGPVTWKNHASKYTRSAARAHVQKLSTTGAQARLANSLSDHGSLFSSDHSPFGYLAQDLAGRSANAFEEMAIQEFWKENIAQADQEYLINRYLNATNRKLPNQQYHYNRLVASAAGSFGYKGEKTIIAQVVKRSADIEAKRRAEAAIVINKFGYSKEFRNMMFDRRYLNDEGVALDANGEKVEDDTNFRELEGKTVEKWHKYIYVDEHNKEIDRAKGDRMSEEQRKIKGIRKVRYSDITDDDGNVVSRVYDDDAGYVKEMIMNDMLIGDPIVRRYAAEIGLPRPEAIINSDPVAIRYAIQNSNKGKGLIRRYRTSVVGAIQASGYNEHNAAYTSMLLAQLNGGSINSIEQLNLAEMMSFNASGKVGKFLLNDGIYYKNSKRLLSCFDNEENFEKYLGDIAVALYGDQNSAPLNGLRLGLDDDGNEAWVEINHTSPDITLDDKKNYIWHKVFPKYVKKVIGALGRKPSPAVIDGMKPENAKPLLELLNFAMQLAEQNADSSIPFEKRLNGKENLLEDTDPELFKYVVDEGRKRVEAIMEGRDPNTVNVQRETLRRLKQHARNTNPTEVGRYLESILSDPNLTPDASYNLFQRYCEMNPLLRDHTTEIREIAENYLYGGRAEGSKAGIAEWFADGNDHREEFLEEIRNRFL